MPIAARLTKRGYQLQAFENQLARPIGDAPGPASSLLVTAATPGQDELWLRIAATGFAVPDSATVAAAAAPSELVENIKRVMAGFIHPEFERLLVWVDGEPAGAANVFVIDGVLGIAGTTTLPAFRRRGVQQAVVSHALNRGLGRASLAMATTEPGSISQRNFERCGFQVMYTRAIFVL